MIQIEELLEKIIAWQDADNIELLDFVLYSNSLSDLESVVSLRN